MQQKPEIKKLNNAEILEINGHVLIKILAEKGDKFYNFAMPEEISKQILMSAKALKADVLEEELNELKAINAQDSKS